MDDAKTIWCGNLSDRVTEELLFELFLQAAPLEKIRIPSDKDGRKSNFAFITFKHEQSVDYALQLLNGVRLFDKNLNVKPRNLNTGTVNRCPERNLNHNDTQLRLGSTPLQNQVQNRVPENRENRPSSKGFRDNYRDERHSPYNNRPEDRDRHDSNKRRHGFNDRRNSFSDRGNNRRGNRYY